MLELLKAEKARHGRVEQKLAALEPLDEEEQRLYDTLDTEQLGQKLELLARRARRLSRAWGTAGLGNRGLAARRPKICT